MFCDALLFPTPKAASQTPGGRILFPAPGPVLPAPAAKAATIISGLVILIGAAYIALGFYADLGALLIFLFLVPTAFLMHPYWKESDAMTKMNEMIAFNKDIALAGAALAFFYIFAKHGETVGLVLSTTTLF